MEQQSTDLVPQQKSTLSLDIPIPSSLAAWLDTARYEALWRASCALAKSQLVPALYQGKPENCFVALQIAGRLNVDPFMALQNIYVVYGNPGISAQLGIALANAAEVFMGPIEYEITGTGHNTSVTASAILRKSGKKVTETVTFQEAMAMGWTKQKDGGVKPMWGARPAFMLKKRAATFLIREHAPEVLLGFKTDEEWEDAGNGVEVRADAPGVRQLFAQAQVPVAQPVAPTVDVQAAAASLEPQAVPPPPAPVTASAAVQPPPAQPAAAKRSRKPAAVASPAPAQPEPQGEVEDVSTIFGGEDEGNGQEEQPQGDFLDV